MSINFNELRELLAAIAQTDIAEVTLKTETFELTVRRGNSNIPVASTMLSPAATVHPSLATTETSTMPPSPEPLKPSVSSPIDKKWIEITSPMVGTFYRAPAPNEPPFVEVGDRISNGQTVCIVEAMKLMNDIDAEVAGEVMEIVIANGEAVEYGQTLMWINPS
ncbi:MAG: acetyl-CoA carboxylase biotin carboxyl carrier protein [cyanobacterium endosymbiont of Rhopalodia musculus]|uniref:acetyl-CoA carboxylase biotin carboxyl carrier protein n=1 Tax=cyanobacterium endosymbiont of Epithemia clementina EcSB TaxID=3034674 RepID=UPI00247FD8A3|nr:acetyl-CoA carboxylase biotin carboxyl carrier protein [cyanobacterium endosymbiont of Epithemia clementina EcSB]WGT67388.1 acetyl-CoA carboxylase biotin carboxyl carrier protein [cyanobacterium endosymbiont of Epithemia clementina EcSB]